MLTHDVIINFLIAVAQFLIGVSTSGFIVVVNAVDFIRQRQMDPLDLLISCLATSRICVQLLAFILPLVLLSFMKQSVLQDINTIIMFMNMWGLWLATWLSVFYCVKIATISHPLFAWLKMRISKLVPWLILGSALYAAIGTGIHINYVSIITEKIWRQFLYSNETHIKRRDIVSYSIFICHLIVPLIIFLIAALLLLFFLGRHTWKMRNAARGTQNPSHRVPLRAMLSILSFLILYLSCYSISTVFLTKESLYGKLFILFSNLIGGSYPSIHSVILILGNPKLKKNAMKFLQCGQSGQ